MSTHKQLFLFAGYNKDCIIDDALIYYVSQLSNYGDVIVCMDCDCKTSEINKIKKYTIHTIAARHGEYDFGSYKRAYQYARDKNILNNYDYVYLVNDSVFGPTINMEQTLKNIESKNTDACSMTISRHKTHSYMESWFVRLNKKIFMSKWIDKLITSVKKEANKYAVTIVYEHGLTNVISKNNCSWDGLYTIRGRETYNNPKYLFKHGCPFVKKLSFTRHNGALGNQIKYILKHCDKNAAHVIMNTSNQLYGKQYVNWLLTNNIFKIWLRNIIYFKNKLLNGGL